MPIKESLLRFLGVVPVAPSHLAPPALALDTDDVDAARARRRERIPYRRIQARILCRPAGLRLFAPASPTPIDPRVRTLRIFSDEALRVGDRLELELFTDSDAQTAFVARVAWLEPLPPGGHSRYDVGLDVERIDPRAAARLRDVLAPVAH